MPHNGAMCSLHHVSYFLVTTDSYGQGRAMRRGLVLSTALALCVAVISAAEPGTLPATAVNEGLQYDTEDAQAHAKAYKLPRGLRRKAKVGAMRPADQVAFTCSPSVVRPQPSDGIL